MAKKSRRVRRKGVQPRLSKAQLVQPAGEETPRVAKAPATELVQQTATSDSRQSVASNFLEEYRYVVKDLQRIGILAAAMLGGLVILSLIL